MANLPAASQDHENDNLHGEDSSVLQIGPCDLSSADIGCHPMSGEALQQHVHPKHTLYGPEGSVCYPPRPPPTSPSVLSGVCFVLHTDPFLWLSWLPQRIACSRQADTRHYQNARIGQESTRPSCNISSNRARDQSLRRGQDLPSFQANAMVFIYKSLHLDI